MNKVLFHEGKQHISIKLNQSSICCLYSLKSKNLVSIKLLQASHYYFHTLKI